MSFLNANIKKISIRKTTFWLFRNTEEKIHLLTMNHFQKKKITSFLIFIGATAALSSGAMFTVSCASTVKSKEKKETTTLQKRINKISDDLKTLEAQTQSLIKQIHFKPNELTQTFNK